MAERYEDRTVDDLHELASEKGIKGQSKMTKAELVSALRGEGDPNDVMVARESGTADIDGMEYTFVRGVTRVARSHPLARAHPDFWEPVDLGLTYDIEQTTASPGEKRG